MNKTVTEAIQYRRSVRVYKDEPIDPALVQQCIVNATLAPTSSNMQLWEFIHITNPELIRELSQFCFNQNAAKTAQNLVVVVARKDLWKQRAQANLAFVKQSFEGKDLDERMQKRKRMALSYYGKLMPMLNMDFFGLFSTLKYWTFAVLGLFKPVYRQLRKSDLRVVAHKSAALAAENFMLSMAEVNYDTCPMEGFDSLRAKRLLNIPRSAEINMIIGCGIRSEKGIYGPRFRVPFDQVYKRID